jgi:outer membrane translocation and assembly module TamA
MFSSAFGQYRKFPLTISKQDRYLFFPLIVKSPEYKWGLGMGGIWYFKPGNDTASRTSSIKATTFATVRRQAVFATEGTLFMSEERYILHYTASVSHFPDRFWGLGNDSHPEQVEPYTISQVDVYPQVLRRILPHLYAGLSYEFQHVFQFSYNDTGTSLFNTQDIVGRNGSRVSGLGFLCTWDSRNNSFSSSGGFYLQYFNMWYRRALGSQFDFGIQGLDVRKYFEVGKHAVLAFQAVTTEATGTIPIRNLSIIGSDSYMRGYYQGRFQDRIMAAVQAEWRTPVHGHWGVVLFCGAGRVASSWANLVDGFGLKPSVGLGLRYAISPREKLNLRFDSGFGTNSHGSYLNLGEAF